MLKHVKNKYQKWKDFKSHLEVKNKVKYYFLDLLETIGTAFLIAFFIKGYIIQVSVVPTGSMIPTMIGGRENSFNDRLFVNKIIYSISEPKRGDIVVFGSPTNDGKDYVKRLIGEPGDIVEIKMGYVYINGKELVLSGVDVQRDSAFYGPRTIDDDSFFMLGDNRAKSNDSRNWGLVHRSDIKGKAVFTFWPFTRMKVLR